MAFIMIHISRVPKICCMHVRLALRTKTTYLIFSLFNEERYNGMIHKSGKYMSLVIIKLTLSVCT